MIRKLGIVNFFKNDELNRKYFFNQVWISYQSDVVKCWWNDKELDCNKYFLSKFADDRLCFSFNTGLETEKFFMNIKGKKSILSKISNVSIKMLALILNTTSTTVFDCNENLPCYCPDPK